MREKLKAAAAKSALIAAVTAVALSTQTGSAFAVNNFDGSCDVYEFCGFRTQSGTSGMYDYDSTDYSFTDNYFHGTSYVVNDAISYVHNRGFYCDALMWWNINGSAGGGVPYRVYMQGGQANLTGGTWDNQGSSLTWDC